MVYHSFGKPLGHVYFEKKVCVKHPASLFELGLEEKFTGEGDRKCLKAFNGRIKKGTRRYRELFKSIVAHGYGEKATLYLAREDKAWGEEYMKANKGKELWSSYGEDRHAYAFAMADEAMAASARQELERLLAEEGIKLAVEKGQARLGYPKGAFAEMDRPWRD